MSVKQKPETKTICPRCHKNEASEQPHRCPYQGDVNNDDDPEYCDCCDDCIEDCALNI